MGSLSPTHWIIVLIVAAILFFGWKQLPDMARSAGKSLRIFKTEMKGLTEDDKAREAHQAEQPPPPPQATTPVAPPAAPTVAGSQPSVSPAVPPAATQPPAGVQPPAPDNQTPRAE